MYPAARREAERRALVQARGDVRQPAPRVCGGALAVLLFTSTAAGQEVARPTLRLPDEDRVRLAEARVLARTIQDSVWPGWGTAPFAVLLVTDSLEFLLWHPRPSAGFQSLGYDSLLAADVLARPRRHPPHFLATFPAVGGVPTIVVGQPANTGNNSTAWVLTLLHEHFHQLQMSHAGYYAAVDSLQLARGDQTGMWMLNYPFPYDSVPIQRRFAALAEALLSTALADPARPPAHAIRRYAAARRDLRGALGGDDARYLDFQLWQEGVARYVEYACARLASRTHAPGASFVALPDFVPYAEEASALREQLLRELRTPDLGANRRVSFYAVGAGLALLLDRTAPPWKHRYFTHMLTLDLERP
jgi:hypothetical protein